MRPGFLSVVSLSCRLRYRRKIRKTLVFSPLLPPPPPLSFSTVLAGSSDYMTWLTRRSLETQGSPRKSSPYPLLVCPCPYFLISLVSSPLCLFAFPSPRTWDSSDLSRRNSMPPPVVPPREPDQNQMNGLRTRGHPWRLDSEDGTVRFAAGQGAQPRGPLGLRRSVSARYGARLRITYCAAPAQSYAHTSPLAAQMHPQGTHCTVGRSLRLVPKCKFSVDRIRYDS